MWASVFSISLLVSILIYAYHVLANFQQPSTIESKQVLILTAHPDDECMFFGPTITALRSGLSKTRVHVLCLSTGIYICIHTMKLQWKKKKRKKTCFSSP